MATFQLFFSVQGTGGSLMGPDPENRVYVCLAFDVQNILVRSVYVFFLNT